MSIPVWKLGATHMSEVLDQYGDPGADVIRTLLADKFKAREENRKAERLAERGTLQKQNPYISDANKCPRQVYYSLTDSEPEPYDFNTLLTFQIGTTIEGVICEVLGEDAGELIREHRVEIETPNTVVTGRSDAEMLGVGNHLFEIKSTNSRAMKFMLKDGREGQDDHRHQLNLYLHASQLGLFPEGRKYNSGWLLYIVKDPTRGEECVFPFRVEYDLVMAANDLTLLDTVAAIVKGGGDIPDRPEGYSKSKFPCSYCNFKDECWRKS